MTAVAVVMLRTTVLSMKSTLGVSSMATPPPSCVATLLAMMLLVTVIFQLVDVPPPDAIRKRRPPPSSFERLSWMMLASIVTAPEPCVCAVGHGRQLAGDQDAAALVVGRVEVDAVVGDAAARRQAVVADGAAVLRGVVPTEVVVVDEVVVGAVEEGDGAGEERAAVAHDPVVEDLESGVALARAVGLCRSGVHARRTDADRSAVGAAVATDNVVRDGQIGDVLDRRTCRRPGSPCPPARRR